MNEQPIKLPQSKKGIWSFIICVGIVPGIALTAAIVSVIAFMLIFNPVESDAALRGFFAPFIVFSVMLYAILISYLISGGLAIASLREKGTRKGFGVTGLILTILGILITMVLLQYTGSAFS
jgi:succinate dehydrogenase hydrophobic anchor subunit